MEAAVLDATRKRQTQKKKEKGNVLREKAETGGGGSRACWNGKKGNEQELKQSGKKTTPQKNDNRANTRVQMTTGTQ